MKSASMRFAFLLAATSAAAACNMGGPAGPPAASPSAVAPTPSSTASPTPAPTPSPTASPEERPAGVVFLDTFDGAALDPGRWTLFENGGVVRVQAGEADMLVGGKTHLPPTLITREDVTPPTGPYYVEWRYTVKAAGRPLSFCLDYVPPFAADDTGAGVPFMSTNTQPAFTANATALAATFTTETGSFVVIANDALKPEMAHTIRLTCDGAGTNHFSVDGVELKTFTSRRRPKHFWVGTYPNRAVGQTAWMHIGLQHVEGGVLP